MSPHQEAQQLADLIELNGPARRAELALVEEPPARALAAREVNVRISEVAETLTPDGEEALYTFFCECGCLQPVPLTLGGYASASGALREGHVLND